MLSGHGSAWRRRRNSRAARIAVPLAIPMALGLTLGIILAVSGGNTTTIEQSALGSCASAAASAAPAASGSQAAPAADASAPAAAASAPAQRERPGVSLGRAGPLPVGIRLSGGVRTGDDRGHRRGHSSHQPPGPRRPGRLERG